MNDRPKRPRDIGNDFVDVLETITKKWTQVKKSEERHPGMVRYRAARMTKQKGTSQTEAASEVMEDAYMAASANGTLPATARQVFYQARPKIMAMTDNKPLASQYFTQVLLPNYMTENGCHHWDVVFDARGHFEEPHTNLAIGLGTLEVRGYLGALDKPIIIKPKMHGSKVGTIGPAGAYSAILFVEKEGFMPLFNHVNLADR
jgi:hypothetical protein